MKARFSLLSCFALVVGLAGFSTFASPAHAGPSPVATISGCYDCNQAGQPGYGYAGDTPVLSFNNTTGGTLNSAQMVLHGYQGANNGVTETVNLGNLGVGVTNFVWGSLPGVSGSTSPGILSAYDYDDEFYKDTGSPFWINDPACGQPANDPTLGATGCVDGGGTYWYAQTGNFDVTFTATVSGGTYDTDAVYSVFSPANNATGGFVGWEGLDPSGYSESPYDVHSGIVTGELADIFLGVPPPTDVPEPLTLSLFGAGLAGALGIRRRGKKIA